MADEKISDMATAGSVADGDYVPILSDSSNLKALFSTIKSYITTALLSNTAFGSAWNGVTGIAPSKNAVYDELHKIDSADDGTIVNAGTGFTVAGAAAVNSTLIGDATSYVPKDIAAWTIKSVSGSNATTTGQTLVDITGLVSDTLVGNKRFEIEVVLLVTTSADTDGCEYGIHCGGSGGGASCNSLLTGSTTTNAATSQTISAVDSATTALLTTSAMNGTIVIKGWVVTNLTSPTISIRHLKVVSGTSSVIIGSVFKYRQVN